MTGHRRGEMFDQEERSTKIDWQPKQGNNGKYCKFCGIGRTALHHRQPSKSISQLKVVPLEMAEFLKRAKYTPVSTKL